MLAAYWGVGQAVDLVRPDTWQEWTLLVVYLVLCAFLLFRDRSTLQQFTLRKWIGWLMLGVFALIASQLFPLTFDLGRFPFIGGGGHTYTVSLLSAVPSLLAGVILGPAPALLVGMSAGLGRALGQSHQVYDLFNYALAAWLAAALFRVNYRGRLFAALRMPVVTGPLSHGAIAFLGGFVVFVLGSELSLLSRLDMALAAVLGGIVPLFVEGLSAGLVVSLILLVMPAWRPGKHLVPAPGERSVRRYLATNLLLFGATVLLIVVTATAAITAFTSTRLMVAELAALANASTARMTDFQAQMENTLVSFGSNDALLDGTKVNARELSRLYRKTQYYEQVLVADGEQKIAESYPASSPADQLTDMELGAVLKALDGESRSFVMDAEAAGEVQVSLVVPVAGALNGSKSALIGRVKESSIAETLGGLSNSNPYVSGAIVNLDGETIVEVGAGEDLWSTAIRSRTEPISVADDYGGTVYLGQSSSGSRQLIYLAPAGNRTWRVAASIPFEEVLSQALGVAAPLLLMLIAVTGVFYARLATYTGSLSGSISELTRTSRRIASGSVVGPLSGIDRQDEVGDLSRALADMQRGTKKRMDELALLLSVSRESSVSFDLNESLPVVLHGALRGTGASGARALVLNPADRRPLSFAEGPAAEGMRSLDYRFMSYLREHSELALGSQQAIQEALGVSQASQPLVKALFALPLLVDGRFRGFLALGFRDQRTFSQNDRELLQTLAHQASVLIEKNYLFTYAEGGRKRLEAVLASTSEAVIVTDQTSRILVINRAMERAFDIDARRVVGRAVADVIDSVPLQSALSAEASGGRDLEIAGVDRRTYFANTSPIINHEGQALGRVAVLHDVTHLKEIDRLKSEFVDNVSHDLRTPLTVLSGYASALTLLDDLTPEQREYSDNILLSVERMIELVENLLDLGRLESGEAMVTEETDMGPLLQDLADEHWLYAHDSGVRVRVRVAEGLPTIRCDKSLIKQAISNLLMNGFKYAPNSGDMTLSAERSEDQLLIAVRDRGPGIDKNDQIRLFEKFYRVKRHGAGAAKGTGLGLAMVKRIAERHGGFAWCESEANQGSTFFISLPIAPIES